MKTLTSHRWSLPPGFSFVEVLAAIAIIGIVTFLAIPNLVQIKQDGEDKLAISRAEALNMAIASYIQANGKTAAWTGNLTNDYANLRPYLSFAPTTLAAYKPSGYNFSSPANITNLSYSNMVYAVRDGSTNRLE
jgi:prepilin-type N-terminal cleavage/methylation domain-containing protein